MSVRSIRWQCCVKFMRRRQPNGAEGKSGRVSRVFLLLNGITGGSVCK